MIVSVAAVISFFVFRSGKSSANLDEFARCLAEKGVAMFGAYWCSHCQNEKEAFGDSFKYINYIECTEKPQECLAKEVKGYPTWIFPDGRKLEGEQGIENLSRESGCQLPDAKNESFRPQSNVLSVHWGDLGARLVETGVMDLEKFKKLYSARGGLSAENLKLLNGDEDVELTINSGNADYVLNFLWAFGLANKNKILEEGPMSDPQFGGPEVFASTGGWTLAKGNSMEHFSRHRLIELDSEEQFKIERVSKNIYRPCCSNPAYFPDCNHGMAMLGLLELMADQGFSEEEMYKAAEKVNLFWFPESYNSNCTV